MWRKWNSYRFAHVSNLYSFSLQICELFNEDMFVLNRPTLHVFVRASSLVFLLMRVSCLQEYAAYWSSASHAERKHFAWHHCRFLINSLRQKYAQHMQIDRNDSAGYASTHHRVLYYLSLCWWLMVSKT